MNNYIIGEGGFSVEDPTLPYWVDLEGIWVEERELMKKDFIELWLE